MSQQATIEYHTKAQGAVLAQYKASRSRVTFIMGPLGSGKTIESCQKTFGLMCEQKPNAQNVRKSRWCAVRNTYPDLMSTTIKDWLELYGELGKFVGGGLEPPHQDLNFLLDDGTEVQAEIIFLALDRPDAVKKLRGMQVTGFWLNEVKELNKQVVDMCDLRHGRYPSAMDGGPTWHGMIGDTNAPDDDHWYYKLAEEIHPEGWVFLRQPGGLVKAGVDAHGRQKWALNPLAENVVNLPPGYYINGAQGKSDDWISVNLANEYGFVAEGKPIYPHYVDSIHCAEFEFHPGLPLFMGVDFGRTPAAVIGQKTPMGQWRIRHEIVTEDMGATEFSSVLNEFIARHLSEFEFEAMKGDPSGDNRAQTDDSTPFLIMRKHGIGLTPTFTNDPVIRRDSMNVPLMRLVDGQPGIIIHPDCKMLRKGMAGGFHYERIQVAGDERFKDVPNKNIYSHVCEAAEYMLIGGGEGKAIIRKKLPTVRRQQYAESNYNILG